MLDFDYWMKFDQFYFIFISLHLIVFAYQQIFVLALYLANMIFCYCLYYLSEDKLSLIYYLLCLLNDKQVLIKIFLLVIFMILQHYHYWQCFHLRSRRKFLLLVIFVFLCFNLFYSAIFVETLLNWLHFFCLHLMFCYLFLGRIIICYNCLDFKWVNLFVG